MTADSNPGIPWFSHPNFAASSFGYSNSVPISGACETLWISSSYSMDLQCQFTQSCPAPRSFDRTFEPWSCLPPEVQMLVKCVPNRWKKGSLHGQWHWWLSSFIVNWFSFWLSSTKSPFVIQHSYVKSPFSIPISYYQRVWSREQCRAKAQRLNQASYVHTGFLKIAVDKTGYRWLDR